MQKSDVESSTYNLVYSSVPLAWTDKITGNVLFYYKGSKTYIFYHPALLYFHLLLILPGMYFSCLELMATPALAWWGSQWSQTIDPAA